MPVHGGVADPGPAGYLVKGRVGTALAEDFSGSGKQQVVVALRTGLDMIRVRDGRLVEHWALLDSTAMQHQLVAQP
jgi:hypothetical protein